MKYSILLLVVVPFLTSSCVRESNVDNAVCYSYINNTNRLVQLEFYDYQNCGDFITEIGNFSKNGSGIITEKCKDSDFVPSPVNLYRFDSIVVKFDNSRKLTYLFRCLDNPDTIFDANFYELEQDGSNYLLKWRFTEEDYNNAEPY